MKQTKTYVLCLLTALFSFQPVQAKTTLSLTANSSTPLTRNPAMVSFISGMNAEMAEFEESTLSKWFAFTFYDLNRIDQVIDQAKLHLSLSALSEDFSYNDMILLYIFDNNEIYDAWNDQIGTEGPTNGILPFRWELGQTHTVTLDLSKLQCRRNKTMFKAIREKGYLDIMVQDDTMVHQLEP